MIHKGGMCASVWVVIRQCLTGTSWARDRHAERPGIHHIWQYQYIRAEGSSCCNWTLHLDTIGRSKRRRAASEFGARSWWPARSGEFSSSFSSLIAPSFSARPVFLYVLGSLIVITPTLHTREQSRFNHSPQIGT